MIDSCAIPSLPPPAKVPLTVLPSRQCPYLLDRVETIRGFLCREMHPAVYHAFMDRAFRRSGNFFYQPVCHGCRECTPIRVPTATFTPSKSQRRVWRRNGDVAVEVSPDPQPTDEKFALYARYQHERHGDPIREDVEGRATDYEHFADFLYTSAVDTIEFAYRESATKKLIGVGICDIAAASLSSVYFYYDPVESRRRSLGVYSAMWEIGFAALEKVSYYYLGYWVRGCATMRYKADFRPHELLGPDGVWREAAAGDGTRLA